VQIRRLVTCSGCCGKRLRAVLKREPGSIATDHMTIPEMDFSRITQRKSLLFIAQRQHQL
jgi:hypothetical protein